MTLFREPGDSLRAGPRDHSPSPTTSPSGAENEAKWTLTVGPDGCKAQLKAARQRSQADCVLKTIGGDLRQDRPQRPTCRARWSSCRARSSRTTSRSCKPSRRCSISHERLKPAHDGGSAPKPRLKAARHRRDRLPRPPPGHRAPRRRSRRGRAVPQGRAGDRRARRRRPPRRRARRCQRARRSRGVRGALPLRRQGLAPARGRRGALPDPRRWHQDHARRACRVAGVQPGGAGQLPAASAIGEAEDDVRGEKADAPMQLLLSLALLPVQALCGARRVRSQRPRLRGGQRQPDPAARPRRPRTSSTERRDRTSSRRRRPSPTGRRPETSSTRATRPGEAMITYNARSRSRRRALPGLGHQPHHRGLLRAPDPALRRGRAADADAAATCCWPAPGASLFRAASASTCPSTRRWIASAPRWPSASGTSTARKAKTEDLNWVPRDPGETLADTVADLRDRGVVTPSRSASVYRWGDPQAPAQG